MKLLTSDEHREIVERLTALAKSQQTFQHHKDGAEYTSLMVCFTMHTVGAAESLLALHTKFGDEWFPSTTGYAIARTLFEIDLNAHYISADPVTRSQRYIEFENVIRKNTLDSIERHRTSPHASWREGLQLMYDMEYAPQKPAIEASYDRVRSQFENSKGKRAKSWAGKSIREIATEVDHLEAYDIFYADLSGFTHVNVMLANRFLRLKDGEPAWSMRADEFDVGNVFRYAATFMSCFLELFGKRFQLWEKEEVMACWDIPAASGRRS